LGTRAHSILACLAVCDRAADNRSGRQSADHSCTGSVAPMSVAMVISAMAMTPTGAILDGLDIRSIHTERLIYLKRRSRGRLHSGQSGRTSESGSKQSSGLSHGKLRHFINAEPTSAS
jgi:hypothetical protein